MRKKHIEALLAKVEKSIEDLTEQQTQSAQDITILTLDDVEVKSCLEHLRTSLDYTVHDIIDYLKAENIKDGVTAVYLDKVYFPFSINIAGFDVKVLKVFKDLKTYKPNVYEVVKSILPFQNNKDWLQKMIEHTNVFKHDTFPEQERINSAEILLPSGRPILTGNNIVMKNTRINGVMQSEELVIKDGRAVSNKDVKSVTIKENSTYNFKEASQGIIDLLKESHKGIKNYVNDLYLEI